MTKTFCDICGKETEVHERVITVGYAASAWQKRKMDICAECRTKLENLHGKVEAEFVKQKGNDDWI